MAGFRGAVAPPRGVGVEMQAEEAEKPPAASSVALVKVSEENKLTTASVLGGLAGIYLGGATIGAILFVATTYLARSDKDSDVSKALTGVAEAGLEALNFGKGLDDKYEVTGKFGKAITDAIETAKQKPEQKEIADALSNLLTSSGEAASSVDKEVNFKDTLGSIVSGASELAYTATSKVLELNEQYKVTDTIKEKIEEQLEKVKSATAKQ